MGSHEGFVYNDELMRKIMVGSVKSSIKSSIKRQFQLPLVEKEVHVYWSSTSYVKDVE